MTVTVILRRRAERDIEIARGWYDAQRSGLGEEFLASVQERLEVIRQFPEVPPLLQRRECGFSLGQSTHGAIEFSNPAGEVILTGLARNSRGNVSSLFEQHSESGIHITPKTA